MGYPCHKLKVSSSLAGRLPRVFHRREPRRNTQNRADQTEKLADERHSDDSTRRRPTVKLHLLTFAGGGIHWELAARRLRNEALRGNTFDSIRTITPRDLARDADWNHQHAAFAQSNPRGYGYWLWKPYLIKTALASLAHDEVLLYLDAGCDLNLTNGAARSRLRVYQELTIEEGLLAFTTPHWVANWTKRDSLRYFGIDAPAARSLHQHEACSLFFSAGERSRTLVDEWYAAAILDSCHLLDDSPSQEPELPDFIEHRHDQALLSCLLHSVGYPSLPREHWFHPDWRLHGRDFPIWATRNYGPYPTPWPLGGAYQNLLWRARGYLASRKG